MLLEEFMELMNTRIFVVQVGVAWCIAMTT